MLSRAQTVIAFLEIIASVWGSVIGLVFVAHVSGVAVLIGLVVLAVFSFFGVAGILLLRGHQLGYPLSVATQVLQIPVFLTPWGGYYCIGGAGLRISLDAEGSFGWYVHLGSQLHFSWAAEPYVTTIGVNVIAIILLVLLIKSRAPQVTPTTSSVARAA
jgi:hypothetical protein